MIFVCVSNVTNVTNTHSLFPGYIRDTDQDALCEELGADEACL